MNITLYGLILSTVITGALLVYFILMKPKKQLTYMFIANSMLLLVWNVSLLLQFLFAEKYNINSIYFDYFTYIGICFIPISLLFSGIIFAKTKITYKKKYLLFFLIPILSLIFLWTNNWHHFFYIHYSTALEEVVYGPWLYIHTIYSYSLIVIGMVYLLIFSIKNSGFFSKQSLWIVVGTVIPLAINLFGSFKIIPMSIYVTPISFTFGISCYALAVFKFGFLKVTAISLQKIVDRISDSYIVLNENNIVTDFNETFLTTFGSKSNEIRNKDIVDLIHTFNVNCIDVDALLKTFDTIKNSNDTFYYEKHFENINKYFNIEINNIKSSAKYVGTLVLLKDITQHMEDLEIIRKNQDMLVEKERLSSLGQLVGGIAHNLKTPIMSIAGAAEGLTDLVKEYDSSIDDPEVNSQDHHDIAHDMSDWIEKIKTHTSYMSDIITAVKGQAVTLNEDEQDSFTIQELIKRVNILMKHELKNALIDMNVKINTDDLLILHGNVNSLVQVINNMVSNAIQAYNGEPNKVIDLVVNKKNSTIVISVQDYGQGINSEVKDKLFKEMITTKGKNGTGLGLFMSYSTIRGHFNGDITFESEQGNGTKFDIILPM